MSAAATSKPPTVRLPSTTVSICSDRVGAVLEQPAACVTLSGVGTVATTAAPLDSVVLEVVPSYRQAQVAGSPPRHASTSSKWCVVVLCSRYSCSSVHSSSTVHVESAVQRQQVDAELNCRGLAGSLDGGPRCCRRRPGDTPRLRNVAATSKPPTVRLPSTTVSICSDKVGGVLEQPAACVTLSGVGTVAIAAELLDSVVLEVVPSYCQAQVAGSLPRHALTSSKWCVVVMCSRYSCSSVHSSWTVHVESAAHRQQADAESAVRSLLLQDPVCWSPASGNGSSKNKRVAARRTVCLFPCSACRSAIFKRCKFWLWGPVSYIL